MIPFIILICNKERVHKIFPEQPLKRMLLKILQISQKAPMLESLFNKIVGLKACNFIKKKLQHCEIFNQFRRTSANDCFCISEIQITNNVIYAPAGNFQFYDLAMQTLVLPNLYLLLRLSCLLNISNLSYSNSLNRLNGLSPYQKFVPMREFMLYFVKLCSRDNTPSQHH